MINEITTTENEVLLESQVFLEDWLVASGIISPFVLGCILLPIGHFCSLKAQYVVAIYLSLIAVTGFF